MARWVAGIFFGLVIAAGVVDWADRIPVYSTRESVCMRSGATKRWSRAGFHIDPDDWSLYVCVPPEPKNQESR